MRILCRLQYLALMYSDPCSLSTLGSGADSAGQVFDHSREQPNGGNKFDIAWPSSGRDVMACRSFVREQDALSSGYSGNGTELKQQSTLRGVQFQRRMYANLKAPRTADQ